MFDNTDRQVEFSEYQNAVKKLVEAGFFQINFFGFGPLNDYTWETSIFIQRDFDNKLLQPIKSIGGIYEKKNN